MQGNIANKKKTSVIIFALYLPKLGEVMNIWDQISLSLSVLAAIFQVNLG